MLVLTDHVPGTLEGGVAGDGGGGVGDNTQRLIITYYQSYSNLFNIP